MPTPVDRDDPDALLPWRCLRDDCIASVNHSPGKDCVTLNDVAAAQSRPSLREDFMRGLARAEWIVMTEGWRGYAREVYRITVGRMTRSFYSRRR